MTPSMVAGRLIITFAAIATLVGPIGADLNPSHVFNPEWPPHARFHSVSSLAMTVGFSLIALWLTWRRSSEPRVSMLVAASVPVLAWGSFFIALLVPGSAVEDHPETLARVAGIPINVVVAAIFSLLAVLGYALYWVGNRSDRTGSSRSDMEASERA